MTAKVKNAIQERDDSSPEPLPAQGAPQLKLLAPAKAAVRRPRVASEVTRYERPSLTKGQREVSAFWVVTWNATGGTRLSRKFSVSYWGEDVARQKAMELHGEHIRIANAGRTPGNGKDKKGRESEPAAAPNPAPTPAKDPDMRYIVRHETCGHAWIVQFTRINTRKYKYFADSMYGGKVSALAVAKAWRDQALAEMDEPAYQIWRNNRTWQSGGSGNAGVSRGVAGCMRSGKLVESPFWRCTWKDADGKRQVRVFFIDTYGEEEAKELAISARLAGLEQVAREEALRQQTPCKQAP